jgi:hypothetical protein
MQIEVKASTGSITSKQEAIEFGRAAARVCYSKHDFEKLLQEEDKSNLIERTLKSGHHSVFDHVQLTLYLKDIPKLGAMLLNNEKYYSTSEKSARYTQMNLEGREKELYDKWLPIFQREISSKYPALNEDKVLKLAQENARYLTSVFTPTKMLHTISFRQLNYLMHFFNDFVKKADDSQFNSRIKAFMSEFNKIMGPFFEEKLAPHAKRRNLSLISGRQSFKEEFGENYSTVYSASFAALAQAQRHRTLNYEIVEVKENEFFVPAILQSAELKKMWIEDAQSVKDNFPQAMLLGIHEYGHYSDFISKANERLCGHAQWEIMKSTKQTLENYLENTRDSNPDVYGELLPYSYGTKCTFPNAKCGEPCPFGPKLGLERLI